MLSTEEQNEMHQDIDMIFRSILPDHGMTERDEQIKLCHDMLTAMTGGQIALTDAGTGIGKTYAYLVAGVVFQKHLLASRPIVLSTASIALQNAIQREYIPFLSKALLDAGYIADPLYSIIRKGKAHYVCDERLRKRLGKVNFTKKNKQSANALLSLSKLLDMDKAEHLSGFDRCQVSVPKVCDCTQNNCRYRDFLAGSRSEIYLFQICNHNLLLADAIHRANNRPSILPDHCALVMDEAHKLPDVAKQMFGRTLSRDDVESLASGLRSERFFFPSEQVLTVMEPIVGEAVPDRETDFPDMPLLEDALTVLSGIREKIGTELSPPLRGELARAIDALSLFTDGESDVIRYRDTDERDRPMLCAAAADRTEQLDKTLWSQTLPIVLTSGTLAVGKDFSLFREEAGLAPNQRVTESVSLSPFDYAHNCLLYVPEEAPAYAEDDLQGYFRYLLGMIRMLVKISNGHALVLFNSYSAMSAIKRGFEREPIPQPVFSMSRNTQHIAEQFKESGNGVLLATGAAWEGFDFPGDMVSMLIIPRLPFPIPDAFSEYQKEQCGSLQAFIRKVAIPDMQIKLRQGFGRAIRLETDTCVAAILDERAIPGARYHAAMKNALPAIPMTSEPQAVERFLRSVKDADFFMEDA